jgi:hypothetical protein
MGDPELSPAFVDVVVAAAERAFARGDVCGGESLLRRAELIAARLGDAERTDAAERALAASPRLTPGRPRLGLDRAVVEIVLQHTLMRWQPAEVGHVPSGDRPKRWLALAPSGWIEAGLEQRLAPILTSIFAISNEQLNHSEPFDANYLGLTSFTARPMTAAELLAEPWREIAAAQVWEPSTTYVVDDGAWFASGPSDFVPMALTSLVLRGELAAADLVDCLVELGFSRETWEERMRDPAGELRAALDYYITG